MDPRTPLEAVKDEALNVIIRKPANRGRENAQVIILQSHVDMVCEKNNDVVFDFDTDAIQTYVDGDWLKAKGTTLGADDGIGVAAALAILASSDIEHGPITALFTSDEETGLTGANALKADFLQGDVLLNLDSEEWGEFCIGCAGGKNTVGTFTYQSEPAPHDYFWFEVQISDLKGGHSGSDITKNWATPIKFWHVTSMRWRKWRRWRSLKLMAATCTMPLPAKPALPWDFRWLPKSKPACC